MENQQEKYSEVDIDTAVNHVMVEKLKGCIYSDPKTACQSLEIVFAARKIAAEHAMQSGDKDAIAYFLHANDLIKAKLFIL